MGWMVVLAVQFGPAQQETRKGLMFAAQRTAQEKMTVHLAKLQ
jgi:hypothetical protein